jgi:hypothetical protein
MIERERRMLTQTLTKAEPSLVSVQANQYSVNAICEDTINEQNESN